MATPPDESTSESDLEGRLIGRSAFQLRSLPVRYRWEATRRHPYYAMQWKWAQDHYHALEAEDPDVALFRQAAVMCLAAIGVSGEPYDPATEFRDIAKGEIKTGWLDGAVQPISMRGLAILLVTSLPRETIGWVGAAILEACRENKPGEPPHQADALLRLLSLQLPGLDDYPDEPYVSINPAASGRSIFASLRKLLPVWKRERSLTEQRDRSKDYGQYLKVWDLREGWSAGAYDRTKEMTLAEIAKKTKKPISTVHNRYCSAFELIVGQLYTPELWWDTVGIIKVAEVLGSDLARISIRRPNRSRGRRDVPETTLQPNSSSDSEGLVSSSAITPDGVNRADLRMGIEDLIQKELSDATIAEKLNLPLQVIPLIRRQRLDGL